MFSHVKIYVNYGSIVTQSLTKFPYSTNYFWGPCLNLEQLNQFKLLHQVCNIETKSKLNFDLVNDLPIVK